MRLPLHFTEWIGPSPECSTYKVTLYQIHDIAKKINSTQILTNLIFITKPLLRVHIQVTSQATSYKSLRLLLGVIRIQGNSLHGAMIIKPHLLIISEKAVYNNRAIV